MRSLIKICFLFLLTISVVGGLSGCWLAGGEGGPTETTSSSGGSESDNSESKADSESDTESEENKEKPDSDASEGEGETSETEDNGEGETPHSDSKDEEGDDKAGHDHKDEKHPEGEKDDHDKSDGGHHGHIGEPAEEPGLLTWRADMALYSLAIFVLLLAMLTKFAWGPIVESIDAREAGIRKNIEDAELARQRAEELLAEHAKKLDSVQDEVREIIAEARRDADHTKNEIISKAQAEAEAERNRAIDEIKRAKDQSLKEIFDTAADQVAMATEHVIGRTLSDDDRGRLIEESLSQFAGQVGENN